MKNIWIRALSGGIIVVALFAVLFYYRSARPYYKAKSEATEMAKKYADLQSTEHFYWFNRQKTVFSLLGKNSNGTEVAIFIPEDGKKVTIMKQADGINEAKAKKIVAAQAANQTFFKANLGMVKNKAVWEVVMKAQDGSLSYYLVDFKSGKITSTISEI